MGRDAAPRPPLFAVDPNYVDVTARIAASLVAGAVIGFERERGGRAAGLRTTMIVCLAACIAMLISDALFAEVAATGVDVRPDPARLAAGVLTGMGFIGAGSIFRTGNRVQGLTTAATLWFVSILGLAFGVGLYFLGGVGVVISLITLALLPALENRLSSNQSAQLTVHVQLDGAANEDLRKRVEAFGIRINRVEQEWDVQDKHRSLRMDLKFHSSQTRDLSDHVIEDLVTRPGVMRVTWS